LTESVEIFRGGASGPFLFTCEHASARIPPPLSRRIAAADRRWLATHWALDLGAAAVTRELARRTGSAAVLSRVSRLVCDANRPPEAGDWIRLDVQGHPLGFNRGVDEGERRRRLRLYHEAYHRGVDRALAGLRPVTLVSVHSFTPRLGGERRTMEAGVLFDERHERAARRLARRLARDGLRTALNRPYSGRRGMIHSVQLHGRAHGLPYLELELRQDLIDSSPRARAMGRRLAGLLLSVLPEVAGSGVALGQVRPQ
jgi:predicted N-formylglutamate amidohydrolase